jgi:hypothetical protein
VPCQIHLATACTLTIQKPETRFVYPNRSYILKTDTLTPKVRKVTLSERLTESSCPPEDTIRSCHPRLSTLHDLARVSTSWLIWVLLLLNLSNHKLKSFGDILIVPCACFGVGTVELFSQSFAILNSDLTLIWAQVTLVPHDDNRNPFRALSKSVLRGRNRMHVMNRLDLPSDSEFCL